MKSFFTILLFFLCCQLSFSQSYPDGPFKDYYDSGELKVEGQYNNKKRVGAWKSYHKNGQISRIYSYKKGKRSKEQISYFKTGIVSYKTEKVGEDYIHSGFYKSGNLKFKRQLESGYYIGYFESGAIKVETNYLKGELVGLWKKYYENGEVEWLVNYKEGYRDGAYKHFYDNGDLKLEGHTSKDKVDGEEKRYLLGNVLEWKGKYTMGSLNKTWTKFNADGEKVEKVKFNDGVTSNSKYSDILIPTKVADGVLERVPIYPGCEELLTNTTRKNCMSKNVNQFIGKNFNTELAADLNLMGRQRIFVMFKINKKGEIVNIRSRAKHPGLEAEAIRVIKLLPSMTPGYQRDKPVIVPFSIPIVFQIAK